MVRTLDGRIARVSTQLSKRLCCGCSLVLRVTKDAFSDSHNVTIGAAFSAKTIHTQHHGDVKLHIWDTAGWLNLGFFFVVPV